MAIGDLLTDEEWIFEFNQTTLYGAEHGGLSLDMQNGSQLTGFARPEAKTQDVNLNFGDGAYGNPDYKAVRVITIPVIFRAGTTSGVPGDSWSDFHNFLTDWTEQVADVSLAIKFNQSPFYVMGRPRAVKDDLSLMRYGIIRALLRFDCLDPTVTIID